MVGTVWHRNIAVSLDGKPARSDGSVDDWLAADFPAEDSGFGVFLAAIDAILMDRATYEAVRRPGDWPYPGEPAVVMTTRPLPPPTRRCERGRATWPRSPPSFKERGHRRVWIVGGGQAVRSIIAAGKFDVFEMALIPTILGEGIPLFPQGTGGLDLRLVKCEAKAKGALHLVYERKGRRRDERSHRAAGLR